MKPKNSKLFIYIILFVLLGAIAFLSLHNITPLSERIEKDVTVNIH
ncbi:MAG: hypothetical protein IKS23_05410 [Alphaproteobacteria bacterium]|nr:hypothetical protein [Alphaproteobacteria bacterium]